MIDSPLTDSIHTTVASLGCAGMPDHIQSFRQKICRHHSNVALKSQHYRHMTISALNALKSKDTLTVKHKKPNNELLRACLESRCGVAKIEGFENRSAAYVKVCEQHKRRKLLFAASQR